VRKVLGGYLWARPSNKKEDGSEQDRTTIGFMIYSPTTECSPITSSHTLFTPFQTFVFEPASMHTKVETARPYLHALIVQKVCTVLSYECGDGENHVRRGQYGRKGESIDS